MMRLKGTFRTRWALMRVVPLGLVAAACSMGNDAAEAQRGIGGTGAFGGMADSAGGALGSGGASIPGVCSTQASEDALRLEVKLPDRVPVPTLGVDDIADLRRGMNLGNALDGPTEGAWGVTLEERHFELIADAGFDHVRLPVRFSAHALSAPPYTIDSTFFERIDWALGEAESHGLAVILDMHHEEPLMSDPASEAERFVALWSQIAERYHERKSSLKYELANEPSLVLNDYWNYIYPKALAAVRAIDPERAVLVDGTDWASVYSLDDLRIIDDPHLVATFHVYDPSLFTMQGASWMDPEFQTQCVVFPGPPAEPVIAVPAARDVDWTARWFAAYNNQPAATNPGSAAAIEDVFAYVDRFVADTGRAVYLGEFAVIDNADAASRERWVRLVRDHAEARKIPWAYWDDGASMAAYNVHSGEWVPYLKRALLDQ